MTTPNNSQILAAITDLSERMDRRFDEVYDRFDRLEDDVGVLKGRMAYDATIEHASRIAHEMALEHIHTLSVDEIDGLIGAENPLAISHDQWQSLRDMDILMLTRRLEGGPTITYVTVEATYTIRSQTVHRAADHADAIRRMTNMQARGAVSGVRVQDSLTREQANRLRVHIHEIKRGEL